MTELEERIHYSFRDPKLLFRALSHSSFSNECKEAEGSNERLEFLGDAVLSLIVSDCIFKDYTHLPEGDLTRIRASLVCEKSLCLFAREIRLGDAIMLGKGERQTGGNERPSILADAFEALIAAIYLDGGIEAAKKFVRRFVSHTEKDVASVTDYKTILQEVIQQNPDEHLTYVLAAESGPDHDKTFTTEVYLNSNLIGTGVGHSKKKSEQAAAREALALMGIRE